jgi:hypothetical protein
MPLLASPSVRPLQPAGSPGRIAVGSVGTPGGPSVLNSTVVVRQEGEPSQPSSSATAPSVLPSAGSAASTGASPASIVPPLPSSSSAAPSSSAASVESRLRDLHRLPDGSWADQILANGMLFCLSHWTLLSIADFEAFHPLRNIQKDAFAREGGSLRLGLRLIRHSLRYRHLRLSLILSLSLSLSRLRKADKSSSNCAALSW